MVDLGNANMDGGTEDRLYNLTGFYEPFSAISHLFGAVLFLALGAVLLYRGRGDRARLIYLGIYAVACVLLFSMSGVYHMVVRGGTAHQVMGRLDHSAIFILIAGTFTPIHGILFRGWLRTGPLILIWACAIAGIIMKTVFYEGLAEWLSSSFYLLLGWIGGFGAVLISRRYGFRFALPIIWGGVIYSIGAVLDLMRWPVLAQGVVHAHEVFHVTVLLAAFCHWTFIWRIARPGRFDPPLIRSNV